MSRVLGVITARLGSTRLPRKPLVPLLGTPLIAWVVERVGKMRTLDRVVVATDSVEVVEVCAQRGMRAVLTDPEHPSGTDRVAEVPCSRSRPAWGLPSDSSAPLNSSTNSGASGSGWASTCFSRTLTSSGQSS